MDIVDTHLHLIYPERLSYPWLQAFPDIARPYRLEDYAPVAAELGIGRALHMEVDVAGADMRAETEFVLGLPAPVVGAIAAARPERADFPAQLDWLAARPGVRGIRRVLHVAPDATSQTPLFVENLRRLAAHRMSFDLCLLARQLPLGAALAQACPEVQFVLDHCGNPDIASGGFAPWSRDLAAIAALPNVAVKLSGILANAAPGWTAATLRPYVERVIEAFGPARMVWGSDVPVCDLGGGLRAWAAVTHQLLAPLSEDERAAILHRNAERLYRL